MTKNKRELTWVAKLKQWRKRKMLDGKRKDFYLGQIPERDNAGRILVFDFDDDGEEWFTGLDEE